MSRTCRTMSALATSERVVEKESTSVEVRNDAGRETS